MQQLKSVNQYAALLQTFKQTHSPIFINCFFSPEEITALTAQMRIRFLQDEDTLLFMVSERHCFRLYFFTSTLHPFKKDAPQFAFRAEKPIVVELISRQESTSEKNPVEAKWTGSGFIWRNTFQRMSVSKEDVLKNNLYSSVYEAYQNQQDISIRTQGDSKIEEILALLELCLDPLSSERPDADKVRAKMVRGQVYFIIDQNEHLCAAMVSSLQKKKTIVDHIGVHPAFRRRGMAQMLLAFFIRANITGDITGYQLWVDKNNLPANRLYENFGFVPDGMRSDLFLLR